MASIRGHQGRIRLYDNGSQVDVVDITGFDVSQDADFSRTEYAGNPVPEGDVTYKGWSGKIDTEVKGPQVDNYIDGLVTNNLNGIGVSDASLVLTEEYPDGTTKSYVYFNAQYKMSRQQRGMSDKVTKTLDFQASGRQALN